MVGRKGFFWVDGFSTSNTELRIFLNVLVMDRASGILARKWVGKTGAVVGLGRWVPMRAVFKERCGRAFSDEARFVSRLSSRRGYAIRKNDEIVLVGRIR
jgi:hypothetical protein